MHFMFDMPTQHFMASQHLNKSAPSQILPMRLSDMERCVEDTLGGAVIRADVTVTTITPIWIFEIQ
jgi:hypothetical protein